VRGAGLKVIARRGMTHGVKYDGVVWRSMVDVGAWLVEAKVHGVAFGLR